MGIRVVTATVLVSVSALTAPPFIVAGAGPAGDVLCTYVELGQPGPAENELQVTTNDYVGEITLSRDGAEILVSEEDDDPLACSGPAKPSVQNVDRIAVRVSRESLDSLTVDLGSGALAPGASAEADATSEIETSLVEAPGTVLSVIGTSAADLIELGSLGGGNYGANLNAADEAVADADVVARNAFVAIALGGGADRVEATGRTTFATRAFNYPFAARGGRGNDALIGNDRRNLLEGGRGRDRLVGGRLGDLLSGGRGSDRIEARDGDRDLVDCGPGLDTVRADRFDRRRNCG